MPARPLPCFSDLAQGDTDPTIDPEPGIATAGVDLRHTVKRQPGRPTEDEQIPAGQMEVLVGAAGPFGVPETEGAAVAETDRHDG